MYPRYVILATLCCCLQPVLIRAARVLAVVPTYSYSHQVNYRPILIELARRGHEVLVITTDPINDPTIKNYSEIDVGHLITPIRAQDFVARRFETTWLGNADVMYEGGIEAADRILGYPPVKALYDSKNRQKFDVLLTEFFWFHAVFGLAYAFECPIVGLSSLGLFNHMDDVMGLPAMSSYPSNWEMGNLTGEHLPFWRRMSNFIIRTNEIYKYRYTYLPKHDQIARKHFGNDIPYIEQIVRNTSIVLMNHHEIMQYPKLSIPKIINIGGIYTSLNITRPVSPKLQKIMDEATDGFVYVSFGSNVQSKNLPDHVKRIFIEVFSKLPHEVIWKYEDESLTSLPPNIHVIKWLQQRAVLGHPNIKMFLCQGGLQSTEEALMFAVPMVGIPFFADQETNVMRMSKLGISRNLEITTITKEGLDEAIRDVLYNKSYKENALKAQSFFRDRPYDTLNYAVWWVEYVIRHKGAPYHYYSIADDAWFSRYDEDVIATLAIIVFIITCLTAITLIKLCQLCLRFAFRAPDRKLKSN